MPLIHQSSYHAPFLADACYSIEQAKNSRYVHLEMPAHGGHVGFVQFNEDGSYWSENRAAEFLGQKL